MNPAQKQKLIRDAILNAVTSGRGGWIHGILPAVKACGATGTMNGYTLRNCLQKLMDDGLICRAAFDPYADDEYYVTPDTPGARSGART